MLRPFCPSPFWWGKQMGNNLWKNYIWLNGNWKYDHSTKHFDQVYYSTECFLTKWCRYVPCHIFVFIIMLATSRGNLLLLHANIKGTDQPAHLGNLIRAFVNPLLHNNTVWRLWFLKIIWKMECLLLWSKCSIFLNIYKSIQNFTKIFLDFFNVFKNRKWCSDLNIAYDIKG